MSWSDLADWWRSELSADPAYEAVVTPLLLEVLRPEPAALYLDLGCGEGRLMRVLQEQGARAHGVDVSFDLAQDAHDAVVALLPETPMADDSYDGVYAVLTIEHLPGHAELFVEAARVTRKGGVMAVVTNHPVWTAPESTPITDSDGEVLWRPGQYFSTGATRVPAGESSIVFHHRTLADLLNAASDAGWTLKHMVEQPHHEFEDQAGIPRLLACRWILQCDRLGER